MDVIKEPDERRIVLALVLLAILWVGVLVTQFA
jgi:hypothetical protein